MSPCVTSQTQTTWSGYFLITWRRQCFMFATTNWDRKYRYATTGKVRTRALEVFHIWNTFFFSWGEPSAGSLSSPPEGTDVFSPQTLISGLATWRPTASWRCWMETDLTTTWRVTQLIHFRANGSSAVWIDMNCERKGKKMNYVL